MMKRCTGLGFYAAAVAMLATMIGPDAAGARRAFQRQVQPRLRSISNRRERGPNGLSFRSLKRAVNAGWTPPQPTNDAMLRHRWFRQKVGWAKVRIAIGQELPGDRELAAA